MNKCVDCHRTEEIVKGKPAPIKLNAAGQCAACICRDAEIAAGG